MTLTLVSLDIGNGRIKARSAQRRINFHNAVAREQGGILFDTGLNGEPGSDGTLRQIVIGFEGKRYAIGHEAYISGRLQSVEMGRQRIGSPAYRRLCAAALAATVRTSRDLAVIASVPVEHYNNAREEARAALAGVWRVEMDGIELTYTVDYDNCHIVPEGFGALCALALAGNGAPVRDDLAVGNVGVVDVGTRTTDLLMFQDLRLVSVQSTGYDESGISVLWQYLKDQIATNHGRRLHDHELDAAIWNGFYRSGADYIPLENEIQAGAQMLADAVSGYINRLWDAGRDAHTLIFTGGGASLIFDRLDYPHRLIVDDPFYGNVEGAYRFGLFRDLAVTS